MWRRCASALIIAIGAPLAAAEVTLDQIELADDGRLVLARFSLNGPITGDEVDQIEALLAAEGATLPAGSYFMDISLNSPGGSFAGGIALLDFFVETGVGTRIASGTECLSACAVAFMGGHFGRGQNGILNRLVEPGGTLGFHAPAMVLPDGGTFDTGQVESAYGLALETVAELMDRENLIPAALIAEIVRTAPDDMFILRSVDDFARFGVGVDWRMPDWEPDPRTIARLCFNGYWWWEEGLSIADLNFAYDGEYTEIVEDLARDVALFDVQRGEELEHVYIAPTNDMDCLVIVYKREGGWLPRIAVYDGAVTEGTDVRDLSAGNLLYDFHALPFDVDIGDLQ